MYGSVRIRGNNNDMSKETNTDEDEEDEEILKLAFPISFERDHTQGPTNALVTLIEYE